MTKERPILFSGAMVRAILDGRKTQTRRVLKRQPYASPSNPPSYSDVEAGDLFICPDFAPTTSVRGSVIAECERPGFYHCMGQEQFAKKHSPYGVAGDRLWVRGTFFPVPASYGGGWYYKATDADDFMPTMTWKPSIHMPRAACRIVLEITGARVERLDDCSEADAISEGVEPYAIYGGKSASWKGSADMSAARDTAREAYRDLWDSINGDGAWAANPWVWVVEFRRVQCG